MNNQHGSDVARERTSSTGSVGSTQSHAKTSGQQTQGLQLLPLLTRHYKTALLLLLVWFMGYFGFSTTWVLIGFFFHVINKEYQKVKKAKRAFAEAAVIDEKAAILARVEELPAWVSDRNIL